jgi:hypothetical protein
MVPPLQEIPEVFRFDFCALAEGAFPLHCPVKFQTSTKLELFVFEHIHIPAF